MQNVHNLLTFSHPTHQQETTVAKPWPPKKDAADDKAKGIKQGSKQDNALDKKRGVPATPFKPFRPQGRGG